MLLVICCGELWCEGRNERDFWWEREVFMMKKENREGKVEGD